MKNLFAKIFLLLGMFGFSQEGQDSLKGVYTNFNQFKSETPESKSNFTFTNRTSRQIWGWGGTEYEIAFENKNIKKKFIKENIWAVNDGKDYYINNRLVSVNNGFDKLIKLDFPLSYFVAYIVMRDENAERAAVASLFGAIGGGYAAIPYKRVVAIDMRTGELFRMNEFGFNTLMGKDEPLLDKYKAIMKQKDNEELIFQILDAYNSKYKNPK